MAVHFPNQQLALKSSGLGTVVGLRQNENRIGASALFHGQLTNAGRTRRPSVPPLWTRS